ncbi:MAG TPA: hypothetical protein VK774_07825, partial [Solirubrobacteraceae bacterium]|nr:hypothetical protein [Solirubrobacteraceae bacterium]
ALGARVSRGPRAELGVLPVELTAAAAHDPVFAAAPASFRTLQWHGETYELPPGATQLARSRDYEQQAFVLGCAYALQFHLEVDSGLAAEWMREPAFVEELQQAHGADAPAALLAEVDSSEGDTVVLARALFSRWLALVDEARA